MSFCLFSECNSYRWILKRVLPTGKKIIIFIGLNPSLANSIDNDRSLTRIIKFCSEWNYRIIYVINLFGLISKSPEKLAKSRDPIGKYNDLVILTLLEFWCKNIDCDIWLGWGDKGNLHSRDIKVLKLIQKFSNLNLTKNDSSHRVLTLGLSKKCNPRHPLYMPKESFLRPFEL